MTIVSVVSLVSVAVSIRCILVILSSVHSASGVLGVSVRCFGDLSACSASGILGICSCICEVLW